MRQRQALKAAARRRTPFERKEVTAEMREKFPFLRHCEAIFVNSRFEVQTYPCETSIGGVMQLNIRRHGDLSDPSYQELMRIKSELFGSDSVAIEVYPREENNWNVNARVRVLWIMPATYDLPVGLEKKNAWGNPQ